jgi:regulator of RNase E activity RraB
MPNEYPNDADGDALRLVASSGNDMSKPMDIDFQVAAPDEATAKRVADEAVKLGYRISIYCDDEEVDEEESEFEEGGDPWTCECTKAMIPTYDAIIAAQLELDAIAKPLGAYSDGWGTFGNKDA